MTKEQLKPLAKQFFKLNSEIKEIFITEDRHCWYQELHAIKFCKGAKEYHRFTPKDLEAKKSEPKPKKKVTPKVKEDE